MNVWYAFLNALGIHMFEMDFMKNALLAVLLLGPLFGLWFQSLFIGITMWALYICIFIVIYGVCCSFR